MVRLARVEVFAADEIAKRLRRVFSFRCSVFRESQSGIDDSTCFHPDVVKEWSDADVARRWLMLCPERRDEKRRPMEPTEFEINNIANSKASRRHPKMHEKQKWQTRRATQWQSFWGRPFVVRCQRLFWMS
jgi:hypothetical protein